MLGVFFLFPGIGLTAAGSSSPGGVVALVIVGALLLTLSVGLLITTFVLCVMCEPDTSGLNVQNGQVIVTAGGGSTDQALPNTTDVELGPPVAMPVAEPGPADQPYPQAGPYAAQPYPQATPSAPPAGPYPQQYPQSMQYPPATATVAPVYPEAPAYPTPAAAYPTQPAEAPNYPDAQTQEPPPPSYNAAVGGQYT